MQLPSFTADICDVGHYSYTIVPQVFRLSQHRRQLIISPSPDIKVMGMIQFKCDNLKMNLQALTLHQQYILQEHTHAHTPAHMHTHTHDHKNDITVIPLM